MIKRIGFAIGLIVISVLGAIKVIEYSSSIGAILTAIMLGLCVVLVIGAIYDLRGQLGDLQGSGSAGQDAKPLADYRRKKALLSAPEWDLYRILKSLCPENRYQVLPQQSLLSVIDKLSQTSYRNELFRLIDFCIMDARTSAPLLLIELNDASHNRADRVERDRKVNAICDKAKMPLVTFTLAESKDMGFVKKQISRYL